VIIAKKLTKWEQTKMKFIPAVKESEPTDAECLRYINRSIEISKGLFELEDNVHILNKLKSLLSTTTKTTGSEKQVAQVGDLIEIHKDGLFLLIHDHNINRAKYLSLSSLISYEDTIVGVSYKIIARAKDLKLVEEIGK
jgi:hypothetical protein